MYRYALIDAKMMAHRQFAIHHNLSTKVDEKTIGTGITYGTLKTIINISNEFGIRKFIFAFEPDSTFRHKMSQEYKANREHKYHQDFIPQFELMSGIMSALGITQINTANYEADDLIATWSTRLNNYKVLIVSSDKDLFTLLNKNISMLRHTPKREFIDVKEFVKRFGFAPELFPIFLALTGDNGDNIIGIKGIGQVRAKELIVNNSSWPKIAKQLGNEDAKKFLRNLQLTRLRADIKTSEMFQCPKSKNMEAFWDIMEKLKFKSMSTRSNKAILEKIHEGCKDIEL